MQSISNNEKISPELLAKCKEYIISYNGEYIDIVNEKDINNLMVLTRSFHDSIIEKIERNTNEENYSIDKQLREDSIWIIASKMKYKIILFYNN